METPLFQTIRKLVSDHMLVRVMKWTPTYPFWSGLGISLGTNILIGIAFAGGLIRYPILSLSSVSMFAAGFFFMWLFWMADLQSRQLFQSEQFSESVEVALERIAALKKDDPPFYSRWRHDLFRRFWLAWSFFLLGLILLVPGLFGWLS